MQLINSSINQIQNRILATTKVKDFICTRRSAFNFAQWIPLINLPQNYLFQLFLLSGLLSVFIIWSKKDLILYHTFPCIYIDI